nr:MAG TPA: hypothetical protein [Caudoviricetes sp.]
MLARSNFYYPISSLSYSSHKFLHEIRVHFHSLIISFSMNVEGSWKDYCSHIITHFLLVTDSIRYYCPRYQLYPFRT